MVELHQLPKITDKKKKRVGLGHGSGRGKTAGRGTSGQKARGKAPISEKALWRRLPLLAGKYRNKPVRKKPIVVNIKYLNLLPPNSIIDINLLAASHIVDANQAKNFGVKILGEGKLSIPLIVKLSCSLQAIKKIEAAGGKVEYQTKVKSQKS